MAELQSVSFGARSLGSASFRVNAREAELVQRANQYHESAVRTLGESYNQDTSTRRRAERSAQWMQSRAQNLFDEAQARYNWRRDMGDRPFPEESRRRRR